MIGYLTGTVLMMDGTELLVETGGVGYRVSVPARVAAEAHIGGAITLWTRQIVREDALELVGFLDNSDTRLFDSLTSISGVGPKAAIAIFALGTAREIQSNILRGEVAFVQGAKGIGKKTAERIVLELKGSLEDVLDAREIGATDSEVIDALVALGYSQRDASETASSIDRDLKVEDRIREALRSMRA